MQIEKKKQKENIYLRKKKQKIISSVANDLSISFCQKAKSK